jgi:hypothetical protein
MRIAAVALVGSGIVVGFVIAFFCLDRDLANTSSDVQVMSKPAIERSGGAGKSLDEPEGGDSLRAGGSGVVAGGSPNDSRAEKGRAAAEFAAQQRGPQSSVAEFARQRDVERLVAAGFSTQRIEWAKRRSEELMVEHQQKEEVRKSKGLAPDPFALLSYMFDPDLDLREEMGESEYENYRSALGRPDGVGVTSVLASSNAEIAGIKAGDEIVRYNGKRVYNLGMLDGLAMSNQSAAPVAIEVMRDGRPVILSVSKGRVGIRNDSILSGVGR